MSCFRCLPPKQQPPRAQRRARARGEISQGTNVRSIVLVDEEATERGVPPAVQGRFELVVVVVARLRAHVDSVATIQKQDHRRRRRIPNRYLLVLHRSQITFDPQGHDGFGVLAQRHRCLEQSRVEPHRWRRGERLLRYGWPVRRA